MLCKDVNPIIGIQVYLELRTRRLFVGLLNMRSGMQGGHFCFTYDTAYIHDARAIPLGPEMPLSDQEYLADTLFIPFVDRIPSKENPAYVEYCEATGIASDESDPFILLATIAHRGPSSFIFEPLYEDTFTAKDLKAFRKTLDLTVPEFSKCFSFSPSSIDQIERSASSGYEVLKRAKIYVRHPQIALEELRKNGGFLHTRKRVYAEQQLRATIHQPP